MATDEEYLDNLLKSLSENEQPTRTMKDVMRELGKETDFDEDSFPVSSDDLADMLDEIDEDNLNHAYDSLSESKALPELEEQPELGEQSELEEQPELEEQSEWKELIESEENVELETDVTADDEINGAEEAFNFADLIGLSSEEVIEDSESTESINLSESQESINPDIDVTDIIDGMENVDDDLAEINGLLKKAEHNESVEEDMLALLESVKDSQVEDENLDNDDVFDIFAEAEGLENSNNFVSDVEAEPQSELKEEKKGLFSKKKKESKKKNKKNKLKDGIEEALDESEESGKNEKKQGFFAKIFSILTQEEDEPEAALDENAEIMKELDEEDKEVAQKKEKKKKEKKQKNKPKGEQVENPEGEEETEDKKKKKKKEKAPKEKKEKKEKDKSTEKPVKVLSKRNMILLVALCATLIGSILALSTFLPEFADKKDARNAFYKGDYETVYELLYDKKLTGSDALIFNRVRTVLRLQRKIDSYENNVALGREAEALNALLEGVYCYGNLTEADEYGIREEVDIIYKKICDILQTKYNITPEYAIIINEQDDAIYTKKLYSIIHGTEYLLPGEEKKEQEESLAPQDVLPEEEEIIDL